MLVQELELGSTSAQVKVVEMALEFESVLALGLVLALLVWVSVRK